jgi:hypothetical protein
MYCRKIERRELLRREWVVVVFEVGRKTEYPISCELTQYAIATENCVLSPDWRVGSRDSTEGV